MLKRVSTIFVALAMLLTMVCNFSFVSADEPMELVLGTTTIDMNTGAKTENNYSATQVVSPGQTLGLVLRVKNYIPCAGIEVLGEYDATKASFVVFDVNDTGDNVYGISPTAFSEKTINGIGVEKADYIYSEKPYFYKSWGSPSNMEVKANLFGSAVLTEFNLFYVQIKIADDATGSIPLKFSFKDHCVIYFTEETGNKEQYYEAGTDYIADSQTLTLQIACTEHDVKNSVTDGVYSHSNTCGNCGEVVDDVTAGECTSTAAGTVHGATCTTAGYTEYAACDVCGEPFTVIDANAPATGHNYVHDEGTEGVNATMSCNGCDDAEHDNVACNFDNGVPTGPSCTEDGYTTYTCSECEYSYKVTDEDSATGHKYDNAPYISDNAGKHYQECTVCGTANTAVDCNLAWNDTDENHKCDLCGHEVSCVWGDWTWNNDNTKDGSKHVRTCPVGGGHTEEEACTWDNGTGTATCTTPGDTIFECTNATCQGTYSVSGEALGHNFVVDGDNGADTTYSCDRCDDTAFDGLPCDFDNGVPVASADPCDVAGTIKYTCQVTDYSYEETDPNAPALGHDYVLDAENGADSTMSCSRGDSANVPCDFDNGVKVPSVDPCTKPGTIKYTCQETSYSYEVDDPDVPVLGHHFVADGDNGADTTYSCDRCTDTAFDNLPCDFDNGVPVASTDPCDVAGTIKYTCQVTEYSYEVTDPNAPALGHDYKHDAGTEGVNATMSCTRGDSASIPCAFDGGVYNGATCDKAGYTRYTCAECGYYHDVDDINAPALGHHYVLDGENKADSTMSCDRCTDTAFDGVPCDFDNGVKVPSTDPCTKPGTIKYTCQETNYSYEVDDPANPATGHKAPDDAEWKYDEDSAPNHVHTTDSKCEVCHEDIPPRACEFVEKIPASTEPGLKECKVCKHQEEIPANACAHPTVREEYKAPTKTVAGYICHRCTLCGEPLSGTDLPAGDHFKDLPAGANVWYYDAAVFAKSYEIITGEYDYLYADRAITRGEVATILGREVVDMLLEDGTISKDITEMTDAEFNALLKALGNKHIGKFQDLKGDYYDRYVKLLNQFGIALGHDDGRFAGDDVVTREELAAFMVRYITYKLPEGKKITDYKFGDVVKAFKDANEVSDWAKATVETARATGLFEGEYEYFNAQDSATRGQMATLMMRVMVEIDEITIVE